MDIQALATDNGLNILKNHVATRVKEFVVLGYKETDNNQLDRVVDDYTTKLESVNSFILYRGNIAKAYYDSTSLLTFELVLPYDKDMNAYVYGVGLIGKDDNSKDILISISKTPKFAKVPGIGGTFIYKVAVSGKAGEIVFSNDTSILFASPSETIAGIIDYKATTPAGIKAIADTKIDKSNTYTKAELDSKLSILLSSEYCPKTASQGYVRVLYNNGSAYAANISKEPINIKSVRIAQENEHYVVVEFNTPLYSNDYICLLSTSVVSFISYAASEEGWDLYSDRNRAVFVYPKAHMHNYFFNFSFLIFNVRHGGE